MSYDLHQVFDCVLRRLNAEPFLPIARLSRELQVGRNTLTKAVRACAHKTVRELRTELMLARTRSALSNGRLSSVKELSFAAGYKSPRAFARAIRRYLGCTPQQLRAAAFGGGTDGLAASDPHPAPAVDSTRGFAR